MNFDTAEVEAEYERFRGLVGLDDPYAGPRRIGIHDVLRAHFLIADFFYQLGEGMGGIGPRSIDLLHSAMGRTNAGFGAHDRWDNDYESCASLFYGLIMNHAFHDANKRTAFLSALFFLQKLGRCPSVHEKVFEDFSVDVADRKLSKYSRYQALSKKDADPEVRFIAEFFKRNSRDFDKRYYAVTYHQLNSILSNFGYGLANPNKNHIDIVRFESRRRTLFGPKLPFNVVVGQIGFPGWTKQVKQGAIQTVRRATKLDVEHHVDSQQFFHGVEPLTELITTYQEPLRRLAQR